MEEEMGEVLQNLLKEKHCKSNLKEEAKKALERIKEYNKEKEIFSNYIKRNPLLVVPFIKILIEIPKKNRIFSISLSLLNRLISLKSISTEYIPFILEGIEKNLKESIEIRLKILPLILPLAEDNILIREKNISKLLNIVIELVKLDNTNKVILQHLISLIFDRPKYLSDKNREIAINDCNETLKIIKDNFIIQLNEEYNYSISLEILIFSIPDKDIYELSYLKNILLISDVLILLIERNILISLSLLGILKCISIFSFHESSNILKRLLEIDQLIQSLEIQEFILKIPEYTIFSILKEDTSLISSIFTTEKIELEKLKLELENDKIEKRKIIQFLKICKGISSASKKYNNILPLFKHSFISLINNLIYESNYSHPNNYDICLIDWNTDNISNRLIDILCSTIELFISSIKDIDVYVNLSKLVYKLTEKNMKIFYYTAERITFFGNEISPWIEFFKLVSKLQDYQEDSLSDKDKGIWYTLPDRLKDKFIDGDKKLNLYFLSKVYMVDLSPERISYFYLYFIEYIDDSEALFFIRKILPLDILKEPHKDTSIFIRTFFRNLFSFSFLFPSFFTLIKEMLIIFEEIQQENKENIILKDLISSLSLGIRVFGESFKNSWEIILKILLLSSDSLLLQDDLVEIIKIITDRMLMSIPQSNLIYLVKILGRISAESIEELASFQALFSLQELIEYIFKNRIENRENIYNGYFCILCSASYDTRENIRNTSISQIFSSILLAQETNCIIWNSLVESFFPRLLSAAVFAKDSIFSEEIDECACNGLGNCSLIYAPAGSPREYEKERSFLESARDILLKLSGLFFLNFNQLKTIPQFMNLWNTLGRVIIIFSSSTRTAQVSISVLLMSLNQYLDANYYTCLFYVICKIISNGLILNNELTIVQILKEIYNKTKKHISEQKELFNSFNKLLKESTDLTSVEYEILSAIKEIEYSLIKEQGILNIIYLSFDLSISNSFVYFILLEFEKDLDKIESTCKTVNYLLEYKRTERKQCWNKVTQIIQRILIREIEQGKEDHLIWVSRRILLIDLIGNIYTNNIKINSNKNININLNNILDTKSTDTSGISNELMNETNELITIQNNIQLNNINETDISIRSNSNNNSHKCICSTYSELSRDYIKNINKNTIKYEKTKQEEIKKYLIFLKKISCSINSKLLLNIFYVVFDLWNISLKYNCCDIYLQSTKLLCHFLKENRLKEEGIKWLLTIITNYNRNIRLQRSLYSYFEREAVAFILDSLLKKEIEQYNELLSGIIQCMSSEDETISFLSKKIIENQFNK